MPRKKTGKETPQEEERILVHVRLRKEAYKRLLDEGFAQRPMKKVQTLAAEILETASKNRS